MAWSREQISLLIDEYKKHRCLYYVKSPLYHNKRARSIALEQIKNELRKRGMGFNINEIKIKFSNLRTNFICQHRKYTRALKNAMGNSQVIKPGLWYYERMTFLLDHAVPKKPIGSLENPVIPKLEISDSENTEEFQSEPQLSIKNKNLLDNSVDYNAPNQNKDVHSTATLVPEIKIVKVVSLTPSIIGEPQSRSMCSIADSGELVQNKITKARQEANKGSFSSDRSKSDKGNMLALSNDRAHTKRETNAIFGDFVASNLDYFEKQDVDTYTDVQEEITHIIFSARRRIIAKNK